MQSRALALAAAIALLAAPATAPADTVFVEAERFADPGGWVPDSQFMDAMGSPFLLAHGLGVPVKDATTTVRLPGPGAYRVWVRTRDWVATWKAPGAPGRFQLLVDGKPLATVFGTEGAEWHWQDGGTATVGAADVSLALHDLTGFEGRCDAIVLSRKDGFAPPGDRDTLAAFRRNRLGLPAEPEVAGPFDLVVVGGGIAGTCAALSAARLGLSVALVQDRPVLGGNNSSEVRVWLQGARNKPPWPRVGDVVRELEQARHAHYGPENTADLYEDAKKLAVVRAEPNVTLFLEHRAEGAVTEAGRIRSVVARHTATGVPRRLDGRWFVDATGDGCLGALAGADLEMSPTGRMGACNLWNVADTGAPASFPRCPWALDLSTKPFPGRGPKETIKELGGWYWESGFDIDPFAQGEAVRDWNFRAMYGAWDALKNVDGRYPTFKLNWSAHVSGKRESRRLLGDVVLAKADVLGDRAFPDGCVPTGWPIDLHLPDPRYEKGFEGNAFISKAFYDHFKHTFWIPYRCLYSRNVPNLFMAGRDVSVTHEALGTARVMRTGGCMGEIVGMAASLCKRHGVDPRGVYEKHLDGLKELMRAGAGKAAPVPAGAVDPKTLPGIVVDDADAETKGTWTPGTQVAGFVGERYLYDARAGAAEARFVFRVPKDGRYEVRIAWRPHDNRASNAAVTVLCADGEKAATVNQREAPPLPGGFASLGAFRFEAGKPAAVVISNRGADGHVVADAVQVLPAGN